MSHLSILPLKAAEVHFQLTLSPRGPLPPLVPCSRKITQSAQNTKQMFQITASKHAGLSGLNCSEYNYRQIEEQTCACKQTWPYRSSTFKVSDIPVVPFDLCCSKPRPMCQTRGVKSHIRTTVCVRLERSHQ